MSFVGNLFGKRKQAASAVLIDIGAESVGGAYVFVAEDGVPVILYARRLPIESRTDEPRDRAMVRALGILGNELIREGAPALARAAGSGRSDSILVSIDVPWQDITMRVENFERKDPFVFTKSMATAVLEKTRAAVPEKVLADESIIGATLNGYETPAPYGKKARRAGLVVLTSYIDKTILESVTATLHGLYHAAPISYIAGRSLHYQAVRIVFPHEHDALVLDAIGSRASVTLIRKNLSVAFAEAANTPPERPWLEAVMGACAAIAKDYPLPRTIFLLARESESALLQHMLHTGDFTALWLSDNPPHIVPVGASTIAGSVRQASVSLPDMQLLLMARYYQTKK